MARPCQKLLKFLKLKKAANEDKITPTFITLSNNNLKPEPWLKKPKVVL